MTRSTRNGFTLAELMVALTLFGIVVTAIVGVVVNMQRSFVRQRENARAEDAMRLGETTLTTVLRAAAANPRGMTGASAPRLDPDPLGHGIFDNLRVVSDFNPPDGDVNDPLEDVLVYQASDSLFIRWQAGGAAAAVAYPVRSLRFEYYTSTMLLTTPAAVANATRVKILLTAPKGTRTPVLSKRQTWVTLRNRR